MENTKFNVGDFVLYKDKKDLYKITDVRTIDNFPLGMITFYTLMSVNEIVKDVRVEEIKHTTTNFKLHWAKSERLDLVLNTIKPENIYQFIPPTTSDGYYLVIEACHGDKDE